MYIQYIKRGIFRAFLAFIGLCAIAMVAPLTHAEGTISVTNATTTEAVHRGVTVSFSVTSPTEQDDVHYGIAVYTKDQSGKILLADFVSSENGVSLPAEQAVSGTITYTPPEQLIGTYDLALVIRGKGGDAVLGETPLDAHTFAMGDAVPLEVTTCQFHTLPEVGSIRCGIGNTGATQQTFSATLTLHRNEAFGAVIGTVTQNITVPAATVAQIDFSNLPKDVTPGAYVAQLSFSQKGSLRARTSVAGTIEMPEVASVVASSTEETPTVSVAPINNVRYVGGLVLALLLLLGVLVLSRRRAPIAAFIILTGAGLVAIVTAPFAIAQSQEDVAFASPTLVNASGNAYCSDFYKPNSVLIHA